MSGYHPPEAKGVKTDVHRAKFLQTLRSLMVELDNIGDAIVVTGDFNINLLKQSSHADIFLEIMAEYGRFLQNNKRIWMLSSK